MPEQPLKVTQLAEELTGIYRRAWEAIVAEQEAIVAEPLAFRRRAQLTELRLAVERHLAGLDAEARTWLQERLPRVYALGAQAGAAAAGEVITTWTTVHIEALQELARDAYDDLLKATRYVRRDTKRFIRELTRELNALKLVRGDTAVQTARDLVRRLVRERGITAVVYRNGARHGLGEYAEMVVRTKTAQAYNAGTLNGAVDVGVRFFEVFDGPNCGWTFHDDTELANGKIVTEDEARSYPISHPNCRRGFGGRPDLTTRLGATGSQTAAQVADQRAADQARQAAQRRRANRRARERRTPRSVGSSS